ncbi:MAG: PaaI family thioesterase [Polyangiales bacterium]
MSLMETIKSFRATGDLSGLVSEIPYMKMTGIEMNVLDNDVVGTMRYSDQLLGNARAHALHGGTLGALLESTSIFKLLWDAETSALPKTINITVQYLRSATQVDTFARAEFIRKGRRVAVVRALAWQEYPDQPVAIANAHFLLVD